MIAAYASLLIILGASATIGQALLTLAAGGTSSNRTRVSWMAPAVGIGLLLVLAGVAARLPGEGITSALVILLLLVASAWWLRGRVEGVGEALRLAIGVVLISTLAASLPFLIAGRVGILGAGLINDDMASHLLIADYVAHPEGYVPTFIRGGYPIGPHAVVVSISEGLGFDLVDVFAGFTLALAPLTGLLALGLLSDLGPLRRITGACLVSLSYLGASFLAQGAFKEPLQALLLMAFAVLLAALLGMATGSGEARGLGGVHPIKRVLPLAILAAAAVFNYSLPGLLWIAAVGGVVVAARVLVVKPRPELPPDWRRRAAPYLFGALGVLVLATAQEWSRIADFARLEALNPDRFGSDLGNLKQAISPLEALGVWPTGDYRTAADAAGVPAIAFYLGALVGLGALALGLIESRRRALWALPAALLAIGLVWGVTALFSTPYIAAKALAIAAPVVMLLAVRGLLSPSGVRWTALATGFILLAGLSSFLALRQAPVRPDAHSEDLAEVREVVEGEEVLFLGRDNFIAWELRGSDEITGVVTNFYSVADARSRFQKGEGGGEKFDVDAVFPQTLDDFTYILSTTGGPRSSPPPRFEPVVENDSYILWERTGLVGRRKTLDEGVFPGAVLDCSTAAGRKVAAGRGTAQVWNIEPVIEGEEGWAPTANPTPAQPASMELKLEPGRWLISLAYDSRSPLRVTSPELGLDEEVDANLDFRGPSPFFPVGEVEVSAPTTATVEVQVDELGLIGRALRAPNEAHLRSLSATPLGVIERIQRRQACDRYVDWYRVG